MKNLSKQAKGIIIGVLVCIVFVVGAFIITNAKPKRKGQTPSQIELFGELGPKDVIPKIKKLLSDTLGDSIDSFNVYVDKKDNVVIEIIPFDGFKEVMDKSGPTDSKYKNVLASMKKLSDEITTSVVVTLGVPTDILFELKDDTKPKKNLVKFKNFDVEYNYFDYKFK